MKVVLHLIAFLKSFFLLKYLTGRVLLGRMVLIKKLLNCTDSIVVEALKIINRVAIDICFPFNKERKDGEHLFKGGHLLEHRY